MSPASCARATQHAQGRRAQMDVFRQTARFRVRCVCLHACYNREQLTIRPRRPLLRLGAFLHPLAYFPRRVLGLLERTAHPHGADQRRQRPGRADVSRPTLVHRHPVRSIPSAREGHRFREEAAQSHPRRALLRQLGGKQGQDDLDLRAGLTSSAYYVRSFSLSELRSTHSTPHSAYYIENQSAKVSLQGHNAQKVRLTFRF